MSAAAMSSTLPHMALMAKGSNSAGRPITVVTAHRMATPGSVERSITSICVSPLSPVRTIAPRTTAMPASQPARWWPSPRAEIGKGQLAGVGSR